MHMFSAIDHLQSCNSYCCCVLLQSSHYLRGNQLRIEDALYLSSVFRVSAFLGKSMLSNWGEPANHMFVTATTASILMV